MRVKSILLALIFGLGIWVVFPYLFIILNDCLGLPIIDCFPLKVFGGVVVFLSSLPILHSVLIFKLLGKGTPVPIEPPKKLVIKGLYRYTRNPMYLSHLMVFVGVFFIFGRPLILLYLVLAAIGFHLLVTKWEEPQLTKRFGKDYLNYLKKVPRWV